MRLHRVRIGGQLAAGVLHDRIARVRRVGRHDADVRRDHVGLQILREIDNALRALDQIRIQRRVVEAVAEVAAERGNHEAVVLDALQKLAARLGIHVLRRKLALRRINLNALCADSRRLIERGQRIGAEAVHQNADGKRIHRKQSFP